MILGNMWLTIFFLVLWLALQAGRSPSFSKHPESKRSVVMVGEWALWSIDLRKLITDFSKFYVYYYNTNTSFYVNYYYTSYLSNLRNQTSQGKIVWFSIILLFEIITYNVTRLCFNKKNSSSTSIVLYHLWLRYPAILWYN